jgi:uncharacterized membrane protein
MKKKLKQRIKNEAIIWAYVLAACLIFSLIMKLLINYPFFDFFMALAGMIYCFFIPGYIIVRLFLDKKFDFWEKMSISFGISVVIQILSLMFITNVLNIKFWGLPNFFVLLAAIIITIIIKIFQKPIIKLFKKPKKKKSKKKK